MSHTAHLFGQGLPEKKQRAARAALPNRPSQLPQRPARPPPSDRSALIRATLHLVNREFEALADDFIELGLLPPGSNRDEIVPALTVAGRAGAGREGERAGVEEIALIRGLGPYDQHPCAAPALLPSQKVVFWQAWRAAEPRILVPRRSSA